jgi:hypothetical protein
MTKITAAVREYAIYPVRQVREKSLTAVRLVQLRAEPIAWGRMEDLFPLLSS